MLILMLILDTTDNYKPHSCQWQLFIYPDVSIQDCQRYLLRQIVLVSVSNFGIGAEPSVWLGPVETFCLLSF